MFYSAFQWDAYWSEQYQIAQEAPIHGGKGDNERQKRKKNIVKPTGLGEKKRLQKPEKSVIITERLEEQEQIAEQLVKDYAETIEYLTLAEIDFEIGTLLRKKLKTKEENERIAMLLILLAANI